MKYSIYNFEKVQNNINDKDIIPIARKNPKDFTRVRKITVLDLLLYILNRRGLTTKMEIADFLMAAQIPDISDVALLKQREKLNATIFKILNDDSIKDFYQVFEKEVKTFKGYVLTAIDGSDWEIPNSPVTREPYKAPKNQCARLKVSTQFDLLNCFILDVQVEKNKYSELKLAAKHLDKAKELTGKFPIIRTMDRSYHSLSDIFHSIQNNDKFVIRLEKEKISKKNKKNEK